MADHSVAATDMVPRRIQLRRTPGWRMPENTTKVDRTHPEQGTPPMPDIPPAGMTTAPLCRPIARLYTVGVREGAPILIALCDDDTLWELDRRGHRSEWLQLPSIPADDP